MRDSSTVACEDAVVPATEEFHAALSEQRAHRESEPIGVYLHVPYCASRCGYCDFNTYTAEELGPGVSRESWLADVTAEIRAAAKALGATGVDTVFFGGGTPTLLPADTLVAALMEVDRCFGLLPGAEVTTEANPESVDAAYLASLRAGGFTRVSIGMQSTAVGVLRVLDRQHSPQRALAAAQSARQSGFDHVSLDLIYGTPGESAVDWENSLQAAVDSGVDHISAYALTLEPGTALAGKVSRGAVPPPDPDIAAERYEAADSILSRAGFSWYEISNFARPGGRCRHNLHYWRNEDWWGVGPGAHSHVGGLRWWNVKHPRTYAASVAQGQLPVDGFEVLDDPARQLEQLMLQVRLREGLPLAGVPRGAVSQMLADGLITLEGDDGERMVLTLRGRLLADRVTLALAD